MGVGDGDARQVVGGREFGGQLVAATQEAGVVRLDPVDLRRQ